MANSNDPPWETRSSAYSGYASFMTSDSEKSFMIFRRFDHLNARNLLLLESEIMKLEGSLHDLEDEGAEATETLNGLRDWCLLKEQADSAEDPKVRERAANILLVSKALDKKLEKYYAAISRTKEIMALPPPKPKNLKYARNVFRRGNGASKSRKQSIQGSLIEHLDSVNEGDLSVISGRELGGLISGPLKRSLTFLHKASSPAVSHQRIQRAMSIMSALAATIFLITAVVTLYFIASELTRLGALCAFTVLFAATLAGCTNATRQEVFVATAAYAAVLVVFVSGDFASFSTTNNTYPGGSVDGATNPQTVLVAQPVTVHVTETAVAATATVISRITQGAVETVFVTTTASPTPTVTQTKGGLAGMSLEAKAGVGVGIAFGAAFGLVILAYILCVIFGCISPVVVAIKQRWRNRPRKRETYSRQSSV